MTDTCTQESGTCPTCTNACRNKPGWFLPGEAEKVADFLGISLEELFETKLGIDWWEEDGVLPLTFILAPSLEGQFPGMEYPGDPNGECVFLTSDDRCAIHPVKPHECASYWCGEDGGSVGPRHRDVARAWVEHQAQLTELLGEEPMAESYSGGIFGMLGL